jgi:[ribosomal protein S5]-alanine N-acetyltransferase
MTISLRKINQDNWKECIYLQVGDDQKSFVATNVFSLAEVSFYSTYEALAIYHDDVMVGFLLYGRDPGDGKYWITRVMIDKKYQHSGYGKTAMLQLIELLKKKNDCNAIYISHEPQNVIADKMYSSLGFKDTGKIQEGEKVKCMELPQENNKQEDKPKRVTERLIIRQFQESDYQDLFEYLSLKDTYKYEPGEPVTLEQARALVAERAKGINFWAAVKKDINKVIGHISLFPEGPKHFMTWDIGYIFNPVYQNQGYATEATKAVMAYAFNQLNAHRITAGCDQENPASWKVLEKCGMRREGAMTHNAYFHLGEDWQPHWINSFHYAILAEEFNKGKTTFGR